MCVWHVCNKLQKCPLANKWCLRVIALHSRTWTLRELCFSILVPCKSCEMSKKLENIKNIGPSEWATDFTERAPITNGRPGQATWAQDRQTNTKGKAKHPGGKPQHSYQQTGHWSPCCSFRLPAHTALQLRRIHTRTKLLNRGKDYWASQWTDEPSGQPKARLPFFVAPALDQSPNLGKDPSDLHGQRKISMETHVATTVLKQPKEDQCLLTVRDQLPKQVHFPLTLPCGCSWTERAHTASSKPQPGVRKTTAHWATTLSTDILHYPQKSLRQTDKFSAFPHGSQAPTSGKDR